MDVVLRKLGYVHLERSSDQSFQTSFVNGAMVKEAIAENAVTVLFSDEVRQQSGKFCLKTDKTVEWLKTLDESVTVIPVSINYDRVLEIDNLVNEMLGMKPARDGPGPRKCYLMKRHFDEHGYTGNCEGCSRLSAGMKGRQHTDVGRKRMY